MERKASVVEIRITQILIDLLEPQANYFMCLLINSITLYYSCCKKYQHLNVPEPWFPPLSCFSPRAGVSPHMRQREQKGIAGGVRGISNGLEAGKCRV